MRDIVLDEKAMQAVGLGGVPSTWGQEQRDRCSRLLKWLRWDGRRLFSID
jgi:hypothetical protein